MSYEDLLERFRALGGVATNVEVREGMRGRGLFPINPALPVRVIAPEGLLAPIEWIGLDDEGQIILNDKCDWPRPSREFFEEYQRQYSWGVVKAGIMKRQQQICDLPEEIKQQLISLALPPETFVQPNDIWCLNKFLNTRKIFYSGNRVLMPVVEFVNFDPKAKNFEIDKGIRITGVFEDEVLIDYNAMKDPFATFWSYGFVAPIGFAISRPLELESPGWGKFIVLDDATQKEKRGNFDVPIVTKKDGVVSLSFLKIGDATFPNQPRWIFQNLMKEIGMQQSMASELFDHITRLNRLGYLQLLMLLDGRDGEVMEELRRAVCLQLMAIA